MEQNNAEQAAFTLMSEASHGQDISRRYNALTSDEQKQVFSEMKNLQMNPETSRLFGSVDLFDSNDDGRMEDARWVGKNGITRDVYDSNADRVADNSSRRSQENPYERVQAERPADDISRQGKAIVGERIDNTQEKSYQRDSHRYGQHGEGNRNHDVRSSIPNYQDYRRHQGGIEERVGRSAENALGRGVQILADEGLRALYRGNRHGQSFGERIERRMGQEARTGTNRAIKDILRRY